jgi:hypothetical protein
MKTLQRILILLILLNSDGCIVKYVPKIDDYEELLVIEGLITDQPGINTIKISKAQPLWKRQYPRPLTGCIVSISSDLGEIYGLKETVISGTYITDASRFRGEVGREYILHIRTTTESVNLSYESLPMKMIPVPLIDSIYYEKKPILQSHLPLDGCYIYLNTHDNSNKCRFYRWEYSETWEFHLPFNFPNSVCWISNFPAEILIKNTSLLAEANVVRQAVVSITDPGDKFSVKYSILVNQFSLNENEYYYWEQLRNTLDQTGGLYDMIPAVIPNNLFCVEEPNKKVLGYFGVSSMSSRRLFIRDRFAGAHGYVSCFTDTIFTTRPDTIPGIYIIEDNSKKVPPYIVFTKEKKCVDCTWRGTNIKPAFWDNVK